MVRGIERRRLPPRLLQLFHECRAGAVWCGCCNYNILRYRALSDSPTQIEFGRRFTRFRSYFLGQRNMLTKYNPAPSRSNHPLLSGPPTLNAMHNGRAPSDGPPRRMQPDAPATVWPRLPRSQLRSEALSDLVTQLLVTQLCGRGVG